MMDVDVDAGFGYRQISHPFWNAVLASAESSEPSETSHLRPILSNNS